MGVPAACRGQYISIKTLVLGKAGFWEMQGVMLEAFGACGDAAAPDRQCCQALSQRCQR